MEHDRRLASEEVLIVKHVFIQWLCHHNLLERWMDNMFNGHRDVERRCSALTTYPHNMLNYSFGFHKSYEGDGFWTKYASEWNKHVYPKLKNKILYET